MLSLISSTVIIAIQTSLYLVTCIFVLAWSSRYIVKQLRLTWQEYTEWMEEWRQWSHRKAKADEDFIRLYRDYQNLRNKNNTHL